MITRPLLAEKLDDMEKVKFPVIGSPKYDGIRCLKVGDKIVTRNFKDLPNKYIRDTLKDLVPNGVDGELMLRNGGFNSVQSEIMSRAGEPDFVYHIFDYVSTDLSTPFSARLQELRDWYQSYLSSLEEPEPINPFADDFDSAPFEAPTKQPCIVLVKQVLLNNVDELSAFEQECVEAGYEGVIIRKPDGPYKCGRSTVNEGILLKIKRFEDSEAIILGFTEKQHNQNEQEKSEIGLSKRSHKKAGMVAAGTLGTLVVKDLYNNIEFEIGTGIGLNDELKLDIWTNKEKYLGRVVSYKFQGIGKDKPRFPSFKGFRADGDMS